MNAGESAYLAIDIGASKTLLAAFTPGGLPSRTHQFPTPKKYPSFLKKIKEALDSELSDFEFRAAAVAVPGKVNRERGLGLSFGNLDWHNVPVGPDIKRLSGGAPTYIENDANLAGLSEALSHKKYKRVLYLTFSTGVGDGIIINGKVDANLSDSEAGQMLIEHNGTVTIWENLASGRAFKTRFGAMAKDVNDQRVWKRYANYVALGLNELLAVLQPDAVIIGGSIGAQFEKFGSFLREALEKHPSKMYDIPPIMKAKRPKEAVIYGCYEYIKQNH